MQRLTSNGLNHVSTILQQAGVSRDDLRYITAEDLQALGVPGPEATRAIAILRDEPVAPSQDTQRTPNTSHNTDEQSLYRDFDEGFGRILAREGNRAALTAVEALRLPRTSGGFAELVRVIESRASQGDRTVNAAFVALADRAISTATREGWDPQVIARANLAVEQQRQRLDEDARLTREANEARKLKRTRVMKGVLGIAAACVGGIGVQKVVLHVQREQVLDGPMRVSLDQESVVITRLGEHPLPATATLFNGRGTQIDDEVPIRWTMKYATPQDACVVSGKALNVLTQNPDLTRDTECTLSYRPASIAAFGFESCTGTCELADGIPGECVDNLCQPPDFDGTIKVKVDLDSSRQSRADAKAEDAKGACFLTTAACEFKGRSDDCHELTTLRWFRDHVMRSRTDWSSDVDAYYDIAPGIVAAVGALPDAARVWSMTFDQHIVPAVACIERGAYEEAYIRYRRLVRRLQKLSARQPVAGA